MFPLRTRVTQRKARWVTGLRKGGGSSQDGQHNRMAYEDAKVHCPRGSLWQIGQPHSISLAPPPPVAGLHNTQDYATSPTLMLGAGIRTPSESGALYHWATVGPTKKRPISLFGECIEFKNWNDVFRRPSELGKTVFFAWKLIRQAEETLKVPRTRVLKPRKREWFGFLAFWAGCLLLYTVRWGDFIRCMT